MQHPLVAEVDANMVNIAVTTMEENKVARLGFADRQQGMKLRAAIARQAEALFGKDMLHETRAVKARFGASATIAIGGAE